MLQFAGIIFWNDDASICMPLTLLRIYLIVTVFSVDNPHSTLQNIMHIGLPALILYNHLLIPLCTDWNWFAGQCGFFSDCLHYYEPHDLPSTEKIKSYSRAVIKRQVPFLYQYVFMATLLRPHAPWRCSTILMFLANGTISSCSSITYNKILFWPFIM